MANIPDCPATLKSVQTYLKTASEHDNRDPIVAYWCRLHALQVGLKLTPKKSPEETKVLVAIMDWLEECKKANTNNDAITNEVAAQAHLENYALKLFLYADKQDREEHFGKNVVKAFYTAGIIYDILTTFGELTEEAAQNRKYAKWKATYIHNCLKNGETPLPGPMQSDENEPADDAVNNQPSGSTSNENPTSPSQVDPSVPTSFGNTLPDPSPSVPTSFGNTLPDPSAVNKLPPVPYTPDPNPGGFVPYDPSTQPPHSPTSLYGDNSNMAAAHLTPDQISKAQKYCKWAGSALSYDDVKTAIINLKNALELLQTGRDPA